MFLGYLGHQNQSREKNIPAKSGFTFKIMFGILTIVIPSDVKSVMG